MHTERATFAKMQNLCCRIDSRHCSLQLRMIRQRKRNSHPNKPFRHLPYVSLTVALTIPWKRSSCDTWKLVVKQIDECGSSCYLGQTDFFARVNSPYPRLLCIKRPVHRQIFFFLQCSWTHDLEFASCLLPAATGSWVTKRVVQFLLLPLGFDSLYFLLLLSSWRWWE